MDFEEVFAPVARMEIGVASYSSRGSRILEATSHGCRIRVLES